MSRGWSNILEGRDLIKEGALWQISDGNSVKVSIGRCFKNSFYRELHHTDLEQVDGSLTVDSSLDSGLENWNLDPIRDHLSREEQDLVLQNQIHWSRIEDRMI